MSTNAPNATAAAQIDDDLIGRIVARALAAQWQQLEQQFKAALPALKAEVEREVRAEFYGEQVYVGKETRQRVAERDAAIVRDHADGRGLSLGALARKYHRSKTQIKRIIDEHKRKEPLHA